MESTRTHPLLTLRALPLHWRDLFSLVCLVWVPAVVSCYVVLFPTSLSLLNLELICRSYGSSGFLECGFVRVPAVVPWYPAVVPLRGHKRQYRSAAVVPPVTPQLYYRWPVWLLPPRLEGSFSRVGFCGTSCGSKGSSTTSQR